MKRYYSLLLLFLLSSFSVSAVLKEKDLEQTLKVLRAELENYRQEQDTILKWYGTISEKQHQQLIATMRRSEQTALMLYSQKKNYTFDLSYACHEATEQYKDFKKNVLPFQSILDNYKLEVDRYNNIIEVLESLPPRKHALRGLDSLARHRRIHMNEEGQLDSVPISVPRASQAMRASMRVLSDSARNVFLLSQTSQADRDSCLALAHIIRDHLIYLYNGVSKDSEHYQFVENRLKKVNDYAMERYADIKDFIFVNGSGSYISILSQFPFYFQSAANDVKDKYLPSRDDSSRSQWRGVVVLALPFFIFFYLILAFLLSNFIIRVAMPKKYKTRDFREKKQYFILAVSMILFSLVLFLLRMFMTHNFFLMASKLLLEYSGLVATVMMSLLLRAKSDQIKSCFLIYTPILLMGFIIIVFRIIFITNSVVSLIFPPILLLFTIWQWRCIHKHKKNVRFSDVFYTLISFVVMLVSCVASWYGYSLLSVQIFIWWIFQLMAIQAITCVYDLTLQYERKSLMTKVKQQNPSLSSEKVRKTVYDMMHPTKKTAGDNIFFTWFYDLFVMTLVPVFSVLSILFCLYLTSSVFDLIDSAKELFYINFINVQGVCELSLWKISLISLIFFVFRFVSYVSKAFYKRYKVQNNADLTEANITLANNIISILVWGFFFVFILVLLRVPKSGISIVTAGLATGVGFALKDVLENFIYGLSLMSGRIRVGDWVECDGIRGKVDSITYQSTQIETLDGSVIAILNTSLFNKSFKNLTKNHGYEYVKISVGVSYGADIEQVRNLLLASLSELKTMRLVDVPLVNKKLVATDERTLVDFDRGIRIYLDDFGDNSLNLVVGFWALVIQKTYIASKVKETIYKTLNDNNIEIPFPQRTVYIKELPKTV
ncbi:MAG: mechanosensitive ion channel family protein [Paludibacteraceae bacterium]|nr:mechanosensitive ion channel family protein [Paludibacteraceae bacterium]